MFNFRVVQNIVFSGRPDNALKGHPLSDAVYREECLYGHEMKGSRLIDGNLG